MRTIFLLLAMYDGRVLIPSADVCRDFFGHLTPDQLARKVGAGQIALPVIRTDPRSQKSMTGVHVCDLADYIDGQRREAEEILAAVHRNTRESSAIASVERSAPPVGEAPRRDRGDSGKGGDDDTSLLPLKRVVAKAGVCRATIYRWIKAGTFPKSYEIAPGIIRWRSDEVEAWITSRTGDAA